MKKYTVIKSESGYAVLNKTTGQVQSVWASLIDARRVAASLR